MSTALISCMLVICARLFSIYHRVSEAGARQRVGQKNLVWVLYNAIGISYKPFLTTASALQYYFALLVGAGGYAVWMPLLTVLGVLPIVLVVLAVESATGWPLWEETRTCPMLDMTRSRQLHKKPTTGHGWAHQLMASLGKRIQEWIKAPDGCEELGGEKCEKQTCEHQVKKEEEKVLPAAHGGPHTGAGGYFLYAMERSHAVWGKSVRRNEQQKLLWTDHNPYSKTLCISQSQGGRGVGNKGVRLSLKKDVGRSWKSFLVFVFVSNYLNLF